jgi:hypothetical protein
VLPRDAQVIHAFDSALKLLVAPRHPLAPRTVKASRPRQHRIWAPGIAPRSERAEFSDQLTEEFDLHVDATRTAAALAKPARQVLRSRVTFAPRISWDFPNNGGSARLCAAARRTADEAEPPESINASPLGNAVFH